MWYNILFALASACFLTIQSCAVMSYFRMRKLQDNIRELKSNVHWIAGLVLGMNLRSDFEQIDNMKRYLQKCVEEDNFEDAQKLKDLIEMAQNQVEKSIKTLDEEFGNFMDLKIMK